MQRIIDLIFKQKTSQEKIDFEINYAFNQLHSEENNFTLAEQTEVIEGLQRKQFEHLEKKCSEIELIRDEIDNLTILSVNS